MKILFFIISIIYSSFTIYSGAVQLTKRNINIKSCFLMIAGGLLIIISLVINSKVIYPVYMLISGLAFIHIAAIDNGIKLYGKINPLHHIIRLGISILIITLYIKIRML
jgi:hypothetical protein